MATLVLEDVGASTPGEPLRLRFDNTGNTDVVFEVDNQGALDIIPDDGVVFIHEDPGVGPAGVEVFIFPTGTPFFGQHVKIQPTVTEAPVGPLSSQGRLGAGIHSNAGIAGRVDDAKTGSESAHMFNGRTSGTRNTLHLEYTAVTPNDEVSRFIECEDATALRMQVWSNGDVENVNNNYGAISDESLKQDIVDADPQSQWDDLKAMRFRKFRLKADVDDRGDDARTCLGCVGQEMQDVSPGLVRTSTKRKVVTESISDDGLDRSVEVEYFNDGPPILSLSYSVLYMKGMVALQEAMRRIEVLEAAARA